MAGNTIKWWTNLLLAFLKNLPLVLFSIILNTLDVQSDLRMIVNLFLGSHPLFAVALLIFFIINYVLGLMNWFMDRTNHWATVIFPLLNLYTPYGKARHNF